MHEVDADDAPDVAAGDRGLRVPQHVVHERVDVARVHREVVDVVRRQIAVAVPAEIGDDDLEARGRERRDVAPPDAFGLGIAVQQEQRVTTDAFSHVREGEVVAHHRALDRELAQRRRRRLRRAELRVVRHPRSLTLTLTPSPLGVRYSPGYPARSRSRHHHWAFATRRDTRLAHAHAISTSRRRRVSTSVLISHSPSTSS